MNLACTRTLRLLPARRPLPAPQTLRTPVSQLSPRVHPNVAARAQESQGGREREPDTSTTYLEAAVPKDQRPVNELAQLKDDTLYSWVSDRGSLPFCMRAPSSTSVWGGMAHSRCPQGGVLAW
jgi:hypothetical protein